MSQNMEIGGGTISVILKLKKENPLPQLIELNFSETRLTASEKQAISQPYSLKKYAEEYKNPQFKQTILEMYQSIKVYRQIRGDGNCFYRASGFYYLENLFKFNLEGLVNLIKTLKNLNLISYNFTYDRQANINQANLQNYFYNQVKEKWSESLQFYFINITQYILNQKPSKTEISQILTTFYNNNPFFDFLMVLLMRSFIVDAIEKYKSEFINFLPENYTLEIINVSTKQYGEDAQDIQIKAMSDALQSHLSVHNLQKIGTKVIFQSNDFSPFISESDSKKFQKINLFYRNGFFHNFIIKIFLSQPL